MSCGYLFVLGSGLTSFLRKFNKSSFSACISGPDAFRNGTFIAPLFGPIRGMWRMVFDN